MAGRESLIFAAIVLDLLLGDPQYFPHPVRIFGKCARILENFFRQRIRAPFWAGLCTALLIYLGASFLPYFTIAGAQKFSPWLSTAISLYCIYASIAIRDLWNHSMAVYRALQEENLVEARQKVGMIVARDTQNLSREEIVRACVESVAESLVDGVTAPLLFAALGGPVWALLYRAINTLDSLFGYRNEKYKDFGTIAARVDDIANFLPARLTAPLIAIAACALRLHPWRSLVILFRDGKKHPSPNSGLSEAAVAGALGVRLGGVNFYQGVKSEKEFLGDPQKNLQPQHIVQANRLMVLTAFLAAVFFLFLQHFFRELL